MHRVFSQKYNVLLANGQVSVCKNSPFHHPASQTGSSDASSEGGINLLGSPWLWGRCIFLTSTSSCPKTADVWIKVESGVSEARGVSGIFSDSPIRQPSLTQLLTPPKVHHNERNSCQHIITSAFSPGFVLVTQAPGNCVSAGFLCESAEPRAPGSLLRSFHLLLGNSCDQLLISSPVLGVQIGPSAAR